MHYLVTGGCGFIGSHLCDQLLANGHDVTVLDDLSTGKVSNLDQRIKFVEGDICDKEQFKALVGDIDGCFHLAAIASVEKSRLEWERTHEVNLGGMVNLLAAISRLEKKVPVVYASSAAVYGDNPNLPLSEDGEVRPLTAYGADKLGCEQHAKVADVVHNIPSIGLRFFNVYGPRQDPSSPYSGVISIFTNRIAQGQDITFFGDGKQLRDFVYVADIVSALSASMKKLHEGQISFDVFAVCTGRATSLEELAATIEEVAGKEVEKHYKDARIGDIKESIGNPHKLNNVLGVEAGTSIANGLALTIG